MNNYQTEILASMGPTMQHEEEISSAIEHGRMNFRIHLGLKNRDYCQYFFNVRKVAKEKNTNVDVLLDLPSSRPRVGEYKSDIILIGEEFDIVEDIKSSDRRIIPIPGINSIKKYINVGDKITFRDGRVTMQIKKIYNDYIKVECVNASIDIVPMCSCSFDDNVIYEPYTDEDVNALDKIKGCGLIPDWVALSFASNIQQIITLRQLLASIWPDNKINVMAKIENRQGLKNLSELVRESDGIMIARGDLLLHVSPIYLPIIQKKIINECKNHQKVSVVATEVLDSLADKGIVNRSELSDIALAVRQKANAIMLAHESANSKFAQECLDLLSHMIDVEEKSLTYEEIIQSL